MRRNVLHFVVWALTLGFIYGWTWLIVRAFGGGWQEAFNVTVAALLAYTVADRWVDRAEERLRRRRRR